MQISKLIKQLQSILECKGDLPILVESDDGQFKNIDFISDTEINCNMYIIISPELNF